MYSVNGIALDNQELGWTLRAGSRPLFDLNANANGITLPGRDGIVPLPSTLDAPVVPLKVRTPRRYREALVALFLSPTLTVTRTGHTDREVRVQYLSQGTEGFGPAEVLQDVTFMLRVNDLFWRSIDEATSPAVALTGASVTVDVFRAISAPVRDAVVRVAGGATGLRVEDSRGSWFHYPTTVPSGSFLRFEASAIRPRAFITDSDTWVGGTEVKVEDGPTPFQITPSFTDPTSRTGRLEVTTTARSGSPAIQVRGRNAFVAAV